MRLTARMSSRQDAGTFSARCRLRAFMGPGIIFLHISSTTSVDSKTRRQVVPGAFLFGSDYFLGGATASLAALESRNFTVVLALILIASPVAGLRPMRAAR